MAVSIKNVEGEIMIVGCNLLKNICFFGTLNLGFQNIKQY